MSSAMFGWAVGGACSTEGYMGCAGGIGVDCAHPKAASNYTMAAWTAGVIVGVAGGYANSGVTGWGGIGASKGSPTSSRVVALPGAGATPLALPQGQPLRVVTANEWAK